MYMTGSDIKIKVTRVNLVIVRNFLNYSITKLIFKDSVHDILFGIRVLHSRVPTHIMPI